MKKYSVKTIVLALAAICLTACSEETKKDTDKSSLENTSVSIQQTEVSSSSEAEKAASDSSKQESSTDVSSDTDSREEDNGKKEPDSTSTEKADTKTVSEANTHYEDDILTLELPQGAFLDEAYFPFNIAKCSIAPDDVYRDLYISFYGEADYDESYPVNFINVSSDFRESLEFFYDESIDSAETAAEYCYKDYVETDYTESNTPDYGCVGRYTTDIDGQTAYVVWHMGSASDLMANCGPSYEIFVDSLKGTIVEIDYSESLGKSMVEKAENVISTIRFKKN